VITLGSVDEIKAWLESAPAHRVLGIIGPPGSGKSTVAHALSDSLQVPHCVVPMDGFHYPQETLRALGRRDRMGAPDTFDTTSLATLLEAVVRRTDPVVFPEFDRTVEEPVPGSIVVLPSHELVIIEGNYLLVDDEWWSQIAAFIDLSIYVALPEDIRLSRLRQRHLDFGKTPSETDEWMARVDEPNARVIEATRTRASALFTPAV
jgi:pantothenate kinase